MWIVRHLAYVMPSAILVAIEYIISSASNIDGIGETVFTECIGKVPMGFFVAGGNEIELVTDSADGATFHLAMQEEAGGNGAIADEDELTEEGSTSLLYEVLHLLASGYADNAVASQHCHIAKS